MTAVPEVIIDIYDAYDYSFEFNRVQVSESTGGKKCFLSLQGGWTES